ncbi:PAS domain S-box protein [Romboutsia ilealis]|uniref:histidine kinase n=1 Tax=Romboutsia faecis TaxID=2764597 RepID=A0ABR7JUT2_9FIRM|nr:MULTISPECIES: ATP-binding protein [Romboutsia]MBC5998361.1 PAS domain-containing protein [Romboutsia faecis]MRN26075.1 PAS domain S-box protein [Romboutsia ilealis]
MYSKELLEQLLDLIPDYIFYRDIDGKNIYCNKSYADNLIGLPKSLIYGKTYDELPVLRKIHKMGKIKDLEVIESKQSVSYEQTVVRHNGDIQEVEVSKYPSFDEKGNIHGILGVIRDISYKNELDKLREGFFSNIGHEFRTPLNMIFSNIQLLEYKCSKCYKRDEKHSCNECFIQNIKQINNNSLRILKLSNNLIDLTNLKSGVYSFSPRNHDIVNFVESICERINEYKKFKNIDLIFDTDIEEIIISFDYLKIERVILNIISNAIKFNKENGTILVCIGTENNFVKISIKDNGVGIPQDRIDNIFEAFYNVEDRFTKISEGSGVGLSLSKSLIDIHRGKINVNSEVGVGSEFIIYLPNIYDEDEIVDLSYLKVDSNSISRIHMELSDIYS